jgi:hypothetical protein
MAKNKISADENQTPEITSADGSTSDSKIKTLAEVEAMTPQEREKFRHSGGTVIANPQP